MVLQAKKHPLWFIVSVSSMFVTYVLIALLFFWSSNATAGNERIVAIDGSLTEIVYALGEGHQLVGRDITSTYPPEALKLPSVGYMRALSAEGILSLRPTLVIATKDAKPQSVLKRLKDAGIRVELIDNTYSVVGVKEKISQVAKVLGKEKLASALNQELQNSVDKAVSKAKAYQQKNGKVRALFILNMRGGNMMVAGKGSRADVMFNLAQITNPAAEQLKGFKPLTAEAAIQYNPQYLITISHGVKSSGGKQAMLNTPAIKMTEAGRNKQLIVMDNGFLTFGPRLGEAITSITDAIYK